MFPRKISTRLWASFMKRRKYEIMAIYDTETTNIGEGVYTRAFPVLFIDNCVGGVDLANYTPGEDDDIRFYRTEEEMLDRIREYVKIGMVDGAVPVICAYNLMFDLQPLMEALSTEYDMRVNAQSSTNVYTVDLYESDTENLVLRFWDTYHLEMRGLKAMGETAGLPKAIGDWDYDLIRTPETPLTSLELFYAGRDTQVIPMYLRYLLRANEWMKQGDLGNIVLTKTSVVRQMARKQIGRLKVGKKNGKQLSLDKAFIEHCKHEDSGTFGQYALRKACFRGGFTFTSAAYAGVVVHNVASLDVTSMHHTFINGRLVPEDFEPCGTAALEVINRSILDTTIEHILEHYEQPFTMAVHERVKFTNLRMKKGTCFEKWGIALLPTSKFKQVLKSAPDRGQDPRNEEQENVVRSYGWYDYAENAICALGKVYSADVAILNVSELELWSIGQVYEWDEIQPMCGEASGKFRTPPDFVTLQSNHLFEMKSKAKFIANNYREGEPYPFSVDGMPEGIAEELLKGTCSEKFFESWYTSTVKGMFNGIYGTQAQDVRKPSYTVQAGELVVDPATKTTPDNFEEKKPGNLRVLYTYGLRIVGGSRMHMIISMILLDRAMGHRCRVLGGDTDSMKVSCDDDVTDYELGEALEPIAEASKSAIFRTMGRVRETWPDYASTLDKIGAFDIENRGHHYPYHIELWNKCRVSYDTRAHVTCAGLRRPPKQVNIETVITEMAKKYGIEKALTECMGYNVCVLPEVSHALEHHKPLATDTIQMPVTDYLGTTRLVTSHQSSALYPASRWLGETAKYTNLATVQYLESRYQRRLETVCRYIGYRDGKIYVEKDTAEGVKRIMEVDYDEKG